MIKKNVGWGFGDCNMNCKHCYNASCPQAPEYKFEELEEIADRICPEISNLNYGTGEFIFNPHVLKLARYISKEYQEIKQALTTNGSSFILMGPEKAKEIFHDIDVSLDFPEEVLHEEFRGHPLAWKWVIETLKACRDSKIEASIVTCVTSQTTDEDIERFLEFALEYGVCWRINWFRKTGRGKSSLQLSVKRVWKIMEFLSKRVVFEALDPLMASILGVTGSNLEGCPCGKLSCRIQTNTTVTPCVFLKGSQWSGGSVKESNLEKIFQSQAFQKFRNRKPHFCQTCQYWTTCQGGCAARAFLHSGDLNAPDDYCPIKADLQLDWIKDTKIEMAKTDKVHSNYLCTLICKPKVEDLSFWK